MLTPGRGTESLSSHHYYRQPLKAAVFFCLLSLATRKRVHILLERNLVTCQIFLQLVLDILLDHLRILPYCIHKVSPAPEIPAPIFILQICVPIENHQCAFTLERPYELCYTHVRWDTHQQMKVIGACLSLDDLYFHLFAQLFDDFDDISAYRLVNHLPSVLRREHHMVFTPVAGVCRVLYFIFHLPKTSLLFRDAVAKPSRL